MPSYILDRRGRQAVQKRLDNQKDFSTLRPYRQSGYKLFTPQGANVKFPGDVPIFGQNQLWPSERLKLQTSGKRYMVRGSQPGSYQYAGPGYNGMLYDYKPNAAYSNSSGGGVSTSIDVPPAPVYNPSVEDFKLPKLELPKRNEKRIEFLSQKASAPGLRAARNQMNRLVSQKFSTPQERAKVMREAFSGIGQAYENILAGGRAQGLSEYMNLEFNPALQKAYNEYTAEVSKQKMIHTEKEAAKLKRFDYAWNTWKTKTMLQEAAKDRSYDWRKTLYQQNQDTRYI